MSKLLLLSNSTLPGTPFFTWPRSFVQEFLSGIDGAGIFIPFAGVTLSWQEYGVLTEGVFSEMGLALKSVHRFDDKKKAVQEAAFIVTGGGNTFALLSRMYEYDLLEVVRTKVANGTPYIGWSAGANLACPTIMTTNDMPVVWPPSLRALDLVPFQLNPHYHELKFEGQGGETRRERLEEFLVMNPDKKVIGLPEGTLLQQDNNTLILQGQGEAKLYAKGRDVQTLKAAGQDISTFVL